MQRRIFWLACVLLPLHLLAQDITYARSCMKSLCSEEFYGRGYVNNGDRIAADFIRAEFGKHKLSPLGENYFQNLGFPVIFYPDRADIDVDGTDLTPGADYILNPGCPTVNGTYRVIRVDSFMIDNTTEYNKLLNSKLNNTFLVVDELKNKKFIRQERARDILNNGIKAKGLIYANNKTLVWSPAMEFAAYPVIYMKEGVLPELVLKMTVKIDAARKVHGTQNVVGMIKGKLQPDSFIVVTAHYDHLGMMGKRAIFPGANDNASGVAMMLDMARHYSKNQPDYSMLFIAFAGEEIGLTGSYYFVQNPLVELRKISMLVNLDLMSTGDEGLTAVNATEFPVWFDNLKLCNSIGNYLPDIAPRGKAQNSDHYYFTEAGVPSFFFYLRGNYHHYHDVDDTYEALTLSKYESAFRLIQDFLNMRMGK